MRDAHLFLREIIGCRVGIHDRYRWCLSYFVFRVFGIFPPINHLPDPAHVSIILPHSKFSFNFPYPILAEFPVYTPFPPQGDQHEVRKVNFMRVFVWSRLSQNSLLASRQPMSSQLIRSHDIMSAWL